MTRTKIIATVGPACAKAEILHRMIREGVNVFRFNFSHGTMEDHQRILDMIRKTQRGTGRTVTIMQDLAGHRIRTGVLRSHRAIVLVTGQRFTLWKKAIAGTNTGVSLSYTGRFTRIQPGQMIYIDDGNIHLKVLRSHDDRLITQVIQGSKLGERKGVNIPDTHLDFPAISAKDMADLSFAIQNRIDYVAQSFVRNSADVDAVKRLLRETLPHCRIIAKIENREGVQNFASILKIADSIMVARGDLGISLPIYEIPILQKWMIAACNHFKKPVITATQMIEHMIDHAQPTRAEVSDVANAVIDGSDFVMLSGETAMGKYPVEVVKMMHRIIAYTEHQAPYRGVRRNR